jgi:hypothetical protein
LAKPLPKQKAVAPTAVSPKKPGATRKSIHLAAPTRRRTA